MEKLYSMKKTILLFILFFSFLAGQAQNQISELSKGLIFAPDLSEWGQGRDAITGTLPTNTAVYPVMGKHGSGRRWLELNGSSSYSALPTMAAFGTADFSVIFRVNIKSFAAQQAICGGIIHAFAMTIETNSTLRVLNALDVPIGSSTGVVSLGINTIEYKRSGTSGTFYINGVASGTITDSSNYAEPMSLLGRYSAANPLYFNGDIYMVRAFNFYPTTLQSSNYSKPEYPIEWVDRGTGAERLVNGDFSTATGWYGYEDPGMSISGGKLNFNSTPNEYGSYKATILTTGKKYRIKYTISGYAAGGINIRMGSGRYGTSRTADGTYTEDLTHTEATGFCGFSAVGTTTASVDDATVYQLGCILDLNAEGMASATWVDKTNTLTATNSGTTYILPPASNLQAMYFNGAAKSAYTGTDGLTGNISFTAQIRPLRLAGRIFDNSKFLIYVNPSGYLTVSRDGTTLINSAAASIAINTTYNIAILSTSAGVTNIYINGVLSGSANQAAGTPASGTLYNIGNNAASNQGFTGIIRGVMLWGVIHNLDDISLVNSIL
jgi:hypothetical protein